MHIYTSTCMCLFVCVCVGAFYCIFLCKYCNRFSREVSDDPEHAKYVLFWSSHVSHSILYIFHLFLDILETTLSVKRNLSLLQSDAH